MEYAIVHGPLGHEAARVCAETRDDVRAYAARVGGCTAISWVPAWRFRTAAGFSERFSFRPVQAPRV